MKNIKEYKTNSVDETIQCGKRLTETLTTGALIALAGDLGVGKTAFTKGIALGLDITEAVTSPTFTLLKEYEGRLNLKHIDAYRLEGIDSDSLGLFDLIDDGNVVVLEWSNFLEDLDFVPDYIVTIDYISENERLIRIEELS
ncbi:tRNA (adenosine(37)-N6)-threonylcarbamoyltransferase complex ATPase subunit type 1 TsaE [Erysipelothrix aquatica]|uniref:tRNA (adenosine(37)-N6)-threonylcarbamoyltransferase complex ATPase subunit type 1 TsaE n=1 Tax=Erysipelothrix aquatica TaxID=2683714 RepID=UPI0013574C33|nr:tRNA (adenosine(37)-N6)-threonylcarbamoyltransferase complex ATPase subunit type 1 TsaE [Erysipelothrix aquatica]